ncbi:MAG: hypothetical protein ACXVFV_07825 [Mycobacteriales bacterium]
MTRPLRRQDWRQLAGEQDGVLSRAQALRSGLTASAWDWHLGTGRWTLLLPGVAVLHSGGPTDGQQAWGAVLHAGPGAALSGDAGLVVHGVRLPPLTALDVAVPWPRNVVGHPLRGGSVLRAHGVRQLAGWVHPTREPPVTLVEVALLHAAAWAASDRAAEVRLAAAVQQGRAQPSRVRDRLAEMPRLPRRALVRTVLDEVELGAHAGSELEFLRFCARHRLPRPDALQVLVRAGGKRYLDGRYVRQRVSVEVDGAHHRLVGQWDADALRSLHLAVARQGTGEELVRLTAGNLRHDGDEVAALLRRLLA